MADLNFTIRFINIAFFAEFMEWTNCRKKFYFKNFISTSLAEFGVKKKLESYDLELTLSLWQYVRMLQ